MPFMMRFFEKTQLSLRALNNETNGDAVIGSALPTWSVDRPEIVEIEAAPHGLTCEARGRGVGVATVTAKLIKPDGAELAQGFQIQVSAASPDRLEITASPPLRQ
jgi:hypothetical protein